MSLKEFTVAIACPRIVLDVNLFEFLITSYFISCYLGFFSDGFLSLLMTQV